MNEISIDKYIERITKLKRHIHLVQESASILCDYWLKHDEPVLAHELAANAFIHDASKFKGIEWIYLHDDVKDVSPDLFQAAWHQHVMTNGHHPEYWGGIEEMPTVYLAEWVCDVKARSAEFGTDLREWIKDKATERFDFSVKGKTYKEIKTLLDIILEKPFS